MREPDPARPPRGPPLAGVLHRLPAPRRSRGTLMAAEPVDPAPPNAEETDAPLVSIDAIRAAADRLAGVAIRTPLVPFGPPERGWWLKAESLQPIGAFKIRGAHAMISGLS